MLSRSVHVIPTASALRNAGARRMMVTNQPAIPPAHHVNLRLEIGAGIGLAFVGAGAWLMMAHGQFARIDHFYSKLRTLQKQRIAEEKA